MATKKQTTTNRMAASLRRAPQRPDTPTPATPPRVKPVRITIDLDPEMHKALKIHAATTGRTVADIIRDHISNAVKQ